MTLRSLSREVPRLLARRLTRTEDGFALIEVMVSAMLVAILATGVLAGLDAAGSTTGANKARGIAASVAQDDQERMRAMKADDLAAARSQQNTVTVAGVNYTVKSSVRPVDEAGGGCGDGTLLKITSVVSWPVMRGVPNVRADSLLAPKPGSFAAGEGGLIIEIRNRSGGPQPGIPVSITGAKSDTDTTDENGCASFLYIPTGNYTVSFSKAGYVTADGTTNVSKTVGAPDGSVSNSAFDYDQAGKITANIVTTPAGGSSQADDSTSLAVGHSSLPVPGARFFAAAPATTPVATTTTLFPFTSAYSVYSGTCVGANPSSFSQTVPTATLSAGGSATVTVTEPAMNIRVRVNGINVAGATVKATSTTCGNTFTFSPTNTPPNGTISTGRLAKPGLPYGNYTVCASALVSGTSRKLTSTQANTTPTGVPLFTVNLTSTAPAGTC
jgi:prepilin-type N-terminal cleavage/methylation domain-containing protein